MEIVRATGASSYEVNLIAACHGGRDLRDGEPLLARFHTTIAGTMVMTERILANVVDAGTTGLPPIEIVGT